MLNGFKPIGTYRQKRRIILRLDGAPLHQKVFPLKKTDGLTLTTRVKGHT